MFHTCNNSRRLFLLKNLTSLVISHKRFLDDFGSTGFKLHKDHKHQTNLVETRHRVNLCKQVKSKYMWHMTIQHRQVQADSKPDYLNSTPIWNRHYFCCNRITDWRDAYRLKPHKAAPQMHATANHWRHLPYRGRFTHKKQGKALKISETKQENNCRSLHIAYPS